MPPLKVTNNSSHNNNASLSSKTTPQIPSTNKISTDKQHRFDNFIQSPYSVHIRIVNTSSSHTNDLSTSIGLGLGLNTTFTVYTIETEIYGPVPQSANTSNCKDSTTDNKSSNILISKFTIMRRHKEFQILYYQLRSAFPFCIIPTLPTIAHTPLSLHKPNTYDMIDDIEVRSQEVEKGGVEVDRNTSQLFQDDDNNSDNDIDDQHNKSTHSEGRSNNTNRHHIKDSYELKVHKRRRRLQLWLQYLSRCSFLVEYSTHFAEFLSGNSTLIPTSDTKAISSCTTGHVADMSLSHSQPQSPAMSLSSSASSFLTSLQTNINSLATILKSPSHILDLLSGKQRIIQAYLNSEHVYVNSRDSLALQLYSQLFHTYLNRMIPIRNRANSSSSVKGNEIHLPKTYRSFDDNDDDEDDEGDYSEAMSAAAISPNKTTTLTSRAYETAIGAISALGSTVLQTHTETGYDTGSLSNLQLPQVLSKTRSELLQQLLLRRMKLVDW